ncbi:pyridoxamine 5'-phosphate oxidase family protein [Luminiphilus syltensis NOR5-1B]|uniref:Pyridoxamine 5'-phosphate oxidase family protein n=1 Tax=Luminiphilus syltensis NOR5-1B TaxID=565045 RepID=B8KVK9_9GAMM|nr:pyridoxamine 5'-phosphate oxidase family protein [Luminiphilus syltensis]EED36487.1 pyridoxamine 5'-phosphate oxidase family protein [Luminiphilus syltensis NOR5-1B]
MAFYTQSQKSMQAQFESEPLAASVEAAIVRDELDDMHRSFIETRDFFFLSTVDSEGCPTVSHKGGAPGIVTVLDSSTIAFPNYDGNGMFLSMGNISDTGKIGLLFIDFETPNRIRIQATASVCGDDDLLERYPGANLIVRARIDKVFLNCARYIHRHQRVESSPYVPASDGTQPFPAWKRIDVLQDSLRPQDKGRAEIEGGTITQDEYGEKLEAGES